MLLEIWHVDENVYRVVLAAEDGLSAPVLATSNMEPVLPIVERLVVGIERASKNLLLLLVIFKLCHSVLCL